MCMGVLARKHSCANTTKMEQLNISRATSLTKNKAIGGRLYEERPSPISQLPVSEPATSAGQSSGVTESAATLHSQTSCASPGQGSDHFSCLKVQHCHITLQSRFWGDQIITSNQSSPSMPLEGSKVNKETTLPEKTIQLDTKISKRGDKELYWLFEKRTNKPKLPGESVT